LKVPFGVDLKSAVCIAALLVMTLNGVLAIEKTSITTDEIIHIAAGYYSLTAAEYRMNAEHPPLAKMVAAAPLLLFLPHDTGPQPGAWNFSERGAHFYNRFWQLNRAAFLSIWFWARTAMLVFPLALGILLFRTTRRWFGPIAAVFAVVFYSLEPTILGHSKVVHTDVPASFVYLLFFVLLYAYHQQPTLRNALWLGLATGIALVTKFSMTVLLAVLAVYFLFQLWPKGSDRRSLAQRIGHPILVATLVVLCINVTYRFRNPPLGPDEAWIHTVARQPKFVVQTIETLSHILPRDFLFGVYVVSMHNSGGDSASILGKYDYRGWWYYFPVAFALKTPLPFLFLSVAGLLWAVWSITRKDLIPLRALLPLAIYTGLVMTSSINIGVRHFLPAFPFLLMLAGAFLARLYEHAPKAGLVVGISAIALMGVETSRTFPYYLSYFNQLKGSNPGWRLLSDSNVEWGDAVPELAEFLKDKGVSRISGALVGGRLTLPFYGIEFIDVFARVPDPPTEYVALGGSFLNGSTVAYGDSGSGRGTEQERIHFFDAYRRLQPVAVFGNSIYVYHAPPAPDNGRGDGLR
jgi:4-amino-4-deoxy-L-arabinose transferase-like glycosyltransferase